jgi:cobyric acid synthase
MLHGLFENASIRASLLAGMRAKRGLIAPRVREVPSRDAEYDRLTEIVKQSLDERMLERILARRP